MKYETSKPSLKQHLMEMPDVTEDFDVVDRPAHYNQTGIECIEYIKQVLGDEGFIAYCLGNTIKYVHRHKYKGKPREDLRKASYYLNKAIDTYGDTE
jgi:hypothetical protein